ncbi:DUF134 domain-containing protein [Clostridium aestuarii]|uniref:UPF0251 protein OW763_07515 n=1 Tax=Clostridium aestuarii TaxID=338193 RepID=A0ABT4CYY8_9CLOT|nr:DUF134 domain-containing protein [Clostridium aestuarii]MCY6484202.1 DUF134 domain-containing protein [Clostridium aestuarii]
MPRPVKWRRVQFFPENNYFVPLGKRKCELQEIVLKIEELEAMRLKDIEKLNQEQCAEKMMVSRQTFQNIIDGARRKVTQALTEGKAIKIEGGNYTINVCTLRCLNCGNAFEINYENNKRECPKCGSIELTCVRKENFCDKDCSRKNKEI